MIERGGREGERERGGGRRRREMGVTDMNDS